MTTRWLLALVLGVSPALAGPAAPPVIHDLPVTPLTMAINVPEIVETYTTLEYFRVTAPSPILTAELNRAIAADARALGGLGAHQASETSGVMGRVTCEAGFVTDVFVSWTCRGDWEAIEAAGGGPGGAQTSAGGAFFIEGGRLHAATLADLLAPGASLASIPTTEDCRSGSQASPYVTGDGIELIDRDYHRGCTYSWEALAPVVAPALRRVVEREHDQAPYNPMRAWAKAPPRFVAEGDAVRDRFTDLLWAAHDNGADLDWAAATAYARAYRGGGEADWRLPTEAELETLAEPLAPHREKADCTRGKNALVVTPLIHLSCGLAWSSTQLTRQRAVGFGFISGTSRAAKQTEKKNYRALVVRGKPPK